MVLPNLLLLSELWRAGPKNERYAGPQDRRAIFLRNAKEAEELAAEAQTASIREMCIKLATCWREMADEAASMRQTQSDLAPHKVIIVRKE